jgi:hypothetical protein
MRNHNAHITYTLQLLSIVLYTLWSVPIAWMCCANIWPASKPLVTMDSMSLIMIPSITCPVINVSCFVCILFTSQVYALSIIIPTSPEFLVVGKSISISCVTNPSQSILLPYVCAKSTMRREKIRIWTMVTSHNIRKGARSGENAGPKPQNLMFVNEYPNVKVFWTCCMHGLL